jgi:hypothetical protein
MQEQGMALVGEAHSTPAVQAELAVKTWPFKPTPTRTRELAPVEARVSPLVVTMLQEMAAGPEEAEVIKPRASTVKDELV